MAASEPRGLTSASVLLFTPAAGDPVRTAAQGRGLTLTQPVIDTHVVWTTSGLVLETTTLVTWSMGWEAGVDAASKCGAVTVTQIFSGVEMNLSLANRHKDEIGE